MRFEAHPVTGKLKVLNNSAALAQAVRCIVMTNRFERPFQPEMGSGIKGSLFENLDSGDVAALKTRVEAILQIYEPRASVLNVSVKNDLDENAYTMSITYLPTTAIAPETVDVFLKRVR